MLLTVIPVFAFPSMSFVGEKRAGDLPFGLNTMFATALAEMEACEIKPCAVIFGDEKDFRVRARNAILQCAHCGGLACDCLPDNSIGAWINFLRLHEWWSAPHWTERIADDRDYYAQCADCGKTTKGTEWPEKCPNGTCPSHAKWIAVNGEITKL